MDEKIWKRRFHVFVALRLAGLAVFFLGLATVFTNLLAPGGSPVIGSIMIILGIVDAVVAPKFLRRQWEKQDREAR